MKRDRASELRAIADGRLMLRVRNGVTVARSMLAMIADEFETMSTALAAKDAELAVVHQQYVDANEARIDAEAALAEARKALEAARAIIQEDRDEMFASVTVAGDASTIDEIDRPAVDRLDAVLVEINAARRAREGGNADG